MKCEECSTKMNRIRDWLYKCPHCGAEMNVSPDFDEHEYHANEAQRLLDSLLFGDAPDNGGFNGDTDFFNRYEDESD